MTRPHLPRGLADPDGARPRVGPHGPDRLQPVPAGAGLRATVSDPEPGGARGVHRGVRSL